MDHRVPTALLITQSVITKAHIRKQIKRDFFLVEESDIDQAKQRTKDSYIDLIIVESAPFFEKALSLSAWIHSALGPYAVPVLLVEPPSKKAEKKAAIEAGIAEFIYDVFNPIEWDVKIAAAFKMQLLYKKIEKTKKQLLQKNTIALSPSFLGKITNLKDEGARQFTLMIQPDRSKKAPFQRVDPIDRINKEVQIHGGKNAVFLPLENGKCRILFTKASEQEIQTFVSHIMSVIPYPMVFSLVKGEFSLESSTKNASKYTTKKLQKEALRSKTPKKTKPNLRIKKILHSAVQAKKIDP